MIPGSTINFDVDKPGSFHDRQILSENPVSEIEELLLVVEPMHKIHELHGMSARNSVERTFVKTLPVAPS
jgi:hypothetical protein